MATRVGIELSPAACRIVEIDAGPPWSRNVRETRVRSFAVLPPSGPETQAKLDSLRRRRAAVVVWSGPGDHRQVTVTAGSYESMRAEALRALGAAGVQTRGVWADIAPVLAPNGRGLRRPVVVTLAPGAAIGAALQPLRDSGIRVRTVMTPAVALTSLARLRRGIGAPGATEAYVVLEETVTCVALMRDGVLIAARDLAWGYLHEVGGGRGPRRREDIATRLSDDLAEFFAGLGCSGAVSQVCVCGGLGELRSMTAPLMERLDIEVETLDSLFGIDAEQLPDPEEEFRERGAELRLAWAAAADWAPPLNLLRARNRRTSKVMLGRAAVVAGVAAGFGVSWAVGRSQWWQSTEPARVTRTAATVPPRALTARVARASSSSQARATPVAPALPVVAGKPPFMTALPPITASKPLLVTAPPPVTASKPLVATAQSATAASRLSVAPVPSPVAVSKPPAVTSPPSVIASRPLVATAQSATAASRPSVAPVPSPVATSKPPAVTSPPPVTASKPPLVTAPPTITASNPPVAPAVPSAPPSVDRRPVAMPSATRVATETPLLASRPALPKPRPAPEPESALPFDAVLGTILYSADRRLAIVDGRIVGTGDEVRGARIVEILPGAVLLRDGKGRLRQLTLGADGR